MWFMTRGSPGEDLRCASVTRAPPLTAPHTSHHRTHKCTTDPLSVRECATSPAYMFTPPRLRSNENVCVCCCKQTYLILHCIPSTHRPTPMSPDLKNPRIPAHFIWRDPSRAHRLSTEQRWRSQREVCLDVPVGEVCVRNKIMCESGCVFNRTLESGLCLLMSTVLS